MKADKVGGGVGAVPPDGPYHQLRVQARVLGFHNQVQSDGVPPFLHRGLADQGDQVHLHLAAFCLFAALFHHQALPGQQVPNGRLGPEGRPGLILHGDDVVYITKLLHRPYRLIATVNGDPGGESVAHSGRHLVRGGVQHLALQHLTGAGKAHRQGQGDGDKGVGIEALGMLDSDTRPEEGALEGTH